MNPTANSDIHEAVVDAISARPYTHRQDVDAGIVAVVTVEADMRFLNATLRSLLTQSVLPGVIVIADATGLTTRSVQTPFEVIHSPAGPAMEVPQAKQVSVQVVRAKGARSFGDAVSKALAAADAQTEADLWVMAPMVADEHEADYFVKLGKSFGLKKVGVMAEVPSIALMADKVAEVADFVSIGTNDLTQYTLAADRTLGSVANYQTAWHPAVLRAIKLIADAGNAHGMPVGVCGEAAADPDLAVVLAGIGVNSLSMTPVALDDVRAELANWTLEEAQEKAAKALNGDFYTPAE